MKIALLSNVTVEVLAGMLGKEHRVWMPSGFGSWMETALEPPQELVAFDPEFICILIDRRFGACDEKVQSVETACARLKERFPRAAVVAPDVARLAADWGGRFYDEKMWTLGKMPFSLKGLRELAKLFQRKKVIAVDLDNTLWKGVVGEDGAENVVPDGAFQEKLLELKRRGILLAALSKNNPDDVEPMWSDPRMTLKKSDFVATAICWREKADTLGEVAADLNLGTDAFVFVDDNPAERAQMRAVRPEVLVADYPPQLDVFFPFATVTAEDAQKTAMYQAEASRRDFASCFDSAEEYLKALEIQTDIRSAVAADVPRIAQLSQKSNQFNVCTNRYSEAEIREMGRTGLVVTAHAKDRFGDQGLIAFVIVKESEILDWVMSCRVMGRGIEEKVEAEVERLAAERGVRELSATWRDSGKNAPVRELFERFGFDLAGETAGEKRYKKGLKKRG